MTELELIARHYPQMETDFSDLCACGSLVDDILEHLAEIVLDMLDAPKSTRRPSRAVPKRSERPAPVIDNRPADRLEQLIVGGWVDGRIVEELGIRPATVRRRRRELEALEHAIQEQERGQVDAA